MVPQPLAIRAGAAPMGGAAALFQLRGRVSSLAHCLEVCIAPSLRLLCWLGPKATAAVALVAEGQPSARCEDYSIDGDGTMPIWRLTPRDLASPLWAASNYTGIAVIRAATERDARQAAVQGFGKELPGISWHTHPWYQLTLVACEELSDSGYPETGPTAILEPAEYTSW